MTLRVGIISANWGAFAHLPAWRALPGVEVTAICTSREETARAAAERHGIARPFWDAQAMAADPDLDIIDCGTRPAIREAMVLACLAHGKHVYNAIPFAKDLDGARALHAAWRASGRVGVVDAYSEWLPAHRVIRDMIDQDYLGQPFGGTCTFNMSLFNVLDPRFPYNWFAEKGHGVSAVRNLGSHAFHMLSFLFGEVEELVAHEARLLPEWRSADGATAIPAETNDFANVLLRFTSGMTLQFQVSWNAPAGDGWYLDMYGSKGRITARSPMFPTPRQTIVHAARTGSTALEPVAIPDSLYHEPGIAIDADVGPVPASYGMAVSMKAMVAAIEGRGRAHPDFEQAWQVERIQEAVRRSNAERRWVRIAKIA